MRVRVRARACGRGVGIGGDTETILYIQPRVYVLCFGIGGRYLHRLQHYSIKVLRVMAQWGFIVVAVFVRESHRIYANSRGFKPFPRVRVAVAMAMVKEHASFYFW